jgi:hypothetical protein
MKKPLLFTATCFLLIQQIRSQTNSFPSSGNVNIYGLLKVNRSDGDQHLLFGSESGIGKVSTKNPFGIGFGTLDFSQSNNTTERTVLSIAGDGYVGIGTTTPGAKLDVNGNANFDGVVFVHAGESNTIAPSSGSISFFGAYSSIRNGTDHSFNIDVYNSSNPINAFKVIQNGNIGIGVPSPAEKFEVNGNIKARKIKVTQTGWSDYVFEPSYRLRPLAEVDRFIKKNGHLPEVPSAKEVEMDGINIGDTQALLLKKIEELTLYIIDINTRLKQVESENKILRSKLKHAKG